VAIFLRSKLTSLTAPPLKEGVVMKKLKNCLYDKDEKRWVEYSEDDYLELKKKRNRERKQAIRDRRCTCSFKIDWYCNGVCESCMYQMKREVSIYAPVKMNSTLTLEGCITDEIDPEKRIAEGMDLEQILLRLDELMPEARIIGRLRLQGKSEDEIADELGTSRCNIYRKIQKVYLVLSREFEEIKDFKKNSQKSCNKM
jgi:hypothetical protein